MDEEIKQKISNKMKGRHVSPDTEFRRGHKVPEEWKVRYWQGKEFSENHRKKISNGINKWLSIPENKEEFLKRQRKSAQKRIKWKITKKELHDLYYNQKLSIRQIAKNLGTKYGVVHHIFERYNIPRRSPKEGKKLNPSKLTEEGREKISKAVSESKKRLWQENPEYRKKMFKILKKARSHITVESIKKMSESRKGQKLSEETKRKIGLASKRTWAKPKYKKMKSKHMKKRMSDPKYKNKILNNLRELEKDSDWLKERNENIGRGNKGKVRSEKYKKKMSKFWKKKIKENPELIKKMLTSHLPTKGERIVRSILDDYFSGMTKYVGDGKVIIGGRNPDHIFTNGFKGVIEVFGRPWHDPDNTFLKKIPYYKTEKGTIEHYEKHGYKCLVIWTDELKNKKKLIKKIQNFFFYFI